MIRKGAAATLAGLPDEAAVQDENSNIEREQATDEEAAVVAEAEAKRKAEEPLQQEH